MTPLALLTLLGGLAALTVAAVLSWLLRASIDPLAAAAGLIAVASLAWNAYAVTRDRGLVKVSWAFVTLSQPTARGIVFKGPPTHISIDARNLGRRPVTLSGMGFDLEQDSTQRAGVWPDLRSNQFPYELLEGKSFSGWADLASVGAFVESNDRFTSAWVRDQTDRYWKTKVSQKDWQKIARAYAACHPAP